MTMNFLSFPFALFRYPKEDPILFIQESRKLKTFSRLSSIGQAKGFVFAPFNLDGSHSTVLLQPSKVLTGWKNIFSLTDEIILQSHHSPKVKNDYFSDYKQAFSTFSHELTANAFEKLVLARCAEFTKDDKFSPFQSFYNACFHYPNAFVSLFSSQKTGMWFGCSPEPLLSSSSFFCQTSAIAGTQSFTEKNKLSAWSPKDQKEQNLVEQYITQCLNDLGIKAHIIGPYSVIAGNVAHIRSDFVFSLPQHIEMLTLLEKLHPTPAVCGLPKEESFTFICKNELIDREYYTGFLGRLDLEGYTKLYVNLRCMKIEENTLRMYAGGGLLGESCMELEWKETQEKMQTLLRIL